jgi:hypothetical protein
MTLPWWESVTDVEKMKKIDTLRGLFSPFVEAFVLIHPDFIVFDGVAKNIKKSILV